MPRLPRLQLLAFALLLSHPSLCRAAPTATPSVADIVFAKVATEMHLALDIFYVVDAAGGKLSDASLPAIEGVLLEALRDFS